MTTTKDTIEACEDLLALLSATETHIRVQVAAALPFADQVRVYRRAVVLTRSELANLGVAPASVVFGDLGNEDDTDELISRAVPPHATGAAYPLAAAALGEASQGAPLDVGPEGLASDEGAPLDTDESSEESFVSIPDDEPADEESFVSIPDDEPADEESFISIPEDDEDEDDEDEDEDEDEDDFEEDPTDAVGEEPPLSAAERALAAISAPPDLPEEEDDLFSDHNSADGKPAPAAESFVAFEEPATEHSAPEPDDDRPSYLKLEPDTETSADLDSLDEQSPEEEDGSTGFMSTADIARVKAEVEASRRARAEAAAEAEASARRDALDAAAQKQEAAAIAAAAVAATAAVAAAGHDDEEDVEDPDTEETPDGAAQPRIRLGRQAPTLNTKRRDAAADLYEKSRSVPRIKDHDAPKVAAAAIQLSPQGGDGQVTATILSDEEEELEIGAAEDYDESYEYDDDADGFSLDVEEYEEEEEEEEEEQAPEPEPEPEPEPVYQGPSNDEIGEMFAKAKQTAERGDLDGGVALYSDVLDADPDHVDASIGRGRLYLDLGDFARAMSDFTVAEDLAPESPEPQVATGDLYFARKEYRKAIDYYTAALDMSPDHAMAFCRRGISNYYRKNYKEALDDLTRAQKLDPDIPNIRTYVSMAKKKKKK